MISDRRDIASLLNKLTENAAAIDIKSVAIGCIPLRPPIPNPDEEPSADKKHVVHEEGDEVESSPAMLNIDPSTATTAELYSHGTVARIVRIEGMAVASSSMSSTSLQTEMSQMSLVVEGFSRFKVTQYRQRTPWIEADVEHFVDTPVEATDRGAVLSFEQLKGLSKELVSLLRMSHARGEGLPPLVARRLEVMIAKRDLSDAGSLADFMVSAVETKLSVRLKFLAATDVPGRLELAVQILKRQIEKIKATTHKRGLTPLMPPPGQPQIIVVNGRKVPGTGRPRRGLGGSGDGQDDADGENEELEELSKRLQEAGLSPEAEKIAKRELQRLKRMSPAQAEYGVCRTYLETLAEVSRVIMNDGPPDSLEHLGFRTRNCR